MPTKKRGSFSPCFWRQESPRTQKQLPLKGQNMTDCDKASRRKGCFAFFFFGVCLCRNKPTPEVNLVVSLTDLVTSVLKFPSRHICPGQCQEPHSETSSFCSTEDPAVPGSQCMAHHHRRSAVKGLRSACAVTFWESYTLTSACQGFCVSLTSSQILKYPQVLASHVVSLLWSGRILPVRTLIAPEPI